MSQKSLLSVKPSNVFRVAPLRALPLAALLFLIFSNLFIPAVQALVLGWDANADGQTKGYNFYYRDSISNTASRVNVGQNTSATITSLLESHTYYFYVAAYDANGVEGVSSTALTHTVPGPVVSNRAPTATARSVSTLQNQPVAVILTGTDPEGSALTFAVQSAPARGSLSGTLPSLIYSPAANYTGSDSFTFTVKDGSLTSVPATISIFVLPVNYPPVAYGQTVQTDKGVSVPITLTGSDPNGTAVSYRVMTVPAHGSLAGTAPNLTYTPTAGYAGPDSFTFQTSDGSLSSPSATVSISVLTVNRAPVANAQSITATVNKPIAVVLSGSDPDGNTLIYSIVAAPTRGALSGTVPNLTYTPNLNLLGADSFTFKVSDGSLSSATATVSINVVASLNRPPVATSKTVQTYKNQSILVRLTGFDPDGDKLKLAISTPPTNGRLLGTPPYVSYTPNSGFVGTDTFKFTASDASATSAPATITVNVQPQATGGTRTRNR